MTPNPPIKGHRLWHEGDCVWRPANPMAHEFVIEYGCECGVQPEFQLTAYGTKRWHRQHKAALRAGVQMSVDIVALADEFSPGSFTERPHA